MDDAFFEALEKVARIRGDCKVRITLGYDKLDLQVLLSAGHQTLALGTLDRMGELEEVGLDRLYR